MAKQEMAELALKAANWSQVKTFNTKKKGKTVQGFMSKAVTGNRRRGGHRGETEVESSPPYLNQRDNKAGSGAVLCSVTSQAMQLIALYGSTEAVNRRAIELTVEHGGTPREDLTQTEDLLKHFYKTLRDTGYWKKLNPKWLKSVHRYFGDAYDKSGYCHVHVMELFGLRSVNKSRLNVKGFELRSELLKAVAKPALDRGDAIVLSTGLTGAGHMVLLVDVLSDGVLLNDPYGAKLPWRKAPYLKNGARPKKPDTPEHLRERFKHNPTLHQACIDRETRANWGERVFYNWTEVDKLFKIGTNVNITGKGDTGFDE